jgi:hypothetical protein
MCPFSSQDISSPSRFWRLQAAADEEDSEIVIEFVLKLNDPVLDPVAEELIEDPVFKPVEAVFDPDAEPVGETKLELLESLFALDEEAVWDADADVDIEPLEDNLELVRE